MLVKVKPGVYINTDLVIMVNTYNSTSNTTGYADLFLQDGNPREPLQINLSAASYLLDLMEANSAVILPGENGYIDPESVHVYDLPSAYPATTVTPESLHRQSLASRVAVLLRDEFTQGATLEDLTEVLKEEYNKVYSAIYDLLMERVAVFDPAEPLRYYHATHRPNKPASKKEIDLITADVDNAPFVAAMRAGELQCVECTHRSCADCVTANACCKCTQPAFMQYTPAPPPLLPNLRDSLHAFTDNMAGQCVCGEGQFYWSHDPQIINAKSTPFMPSGVDNPITGERLDWRWCEQCQRPRWQHAFNAIAANDGLECPPEDLRFNKCANCGGFAELNGHCFYCATETSAEGYGLGPPTKGYWSEY